MFFHSFLSFFWGQSCLSFSFLLVVWFLQSLGFFLIVLVCVHNCYATCFHFICVLGALVMLFSDIFLKFWIPEFTLPSMECVPFP